MIESTTTSWRMKPWREHRTIKSTGSEWTNVKHLPVALAPGSSGRPNGSVKDEVKMSDRERIIFENGGAIHEEEGEKLVLTFPDGKQHRMTGHIDWDHEIEVWANVCNEDTGDCDLWRQTFPSEGGTICTRVSAHDSYYSASVAPEGKPTSNPEDPDYPDHGLPLVEIEGEGIVFEGWLKLAPPVPLGWLLNE